MIVLSLCSYFRTPHLCLCFFADDELEQGSRLPLCGHRVTVHALLLQFCFQCVPLIFFFPRKMNTTVDIPVVIVMADNRSLSRSLVRSGSELLDDSMRNRPRRSSSTAVRPKSVFQSPKPHKTGFEFDSPPPMPHHIPPAPPVTSEAFVKVFAMLCQHPDKRQQDSMLSAGSEVRVVTLAGRSFSSHQQPPDQRTMCFSCEICRLLSLCARAMPTIRCTRSRRCSSRLIPATTSFSHFCPSCWTALMASTVLLW